MDGLENPTPAARALAEHLSSLLGATARVILHYGSRAQGRATRPDSPFDFFIVVDSYRHAYRALGAELGSRRRMRVALALAWVLPPSAIAVRQGGPDGEREAKCVIISTRHLRRECSPRARDHFVRARLSQRVVIVWSRDATSATAMLRSVREVRERSFEWVRVFLPARFDLTRYCRTLLAVSLASEIRLEAREHAETLFAAQRDWLLGTYGHVLERLRERGALAGDGDAFLQTRPAGPVARLKVRAYFGWSRLRTTLRLFKHPFLYDGWLDYLVRKIDRSTGLKIELTERERRWPLLFLWPRAVRHLRSRPQRRR